MLNKKELQKWESLGKGILEIVSSVRNRFPGLQMELSLHPQTFYDKMPMPPLFSEDARSALLPKFQVVTELGAIERYCDVNVVIPKQDKIRYQVNAVLGINEDEMHLYVPDAKAYFCWFPFTADRVDSFIDAMCGFTSGSHRIVTKSIGDSCLFYILESPTERGWESVASGGSALEWICWWLPHKIRIFQNG